MLEMYRLAIGYVGLVFSIYWYQIGSLMELELEWVWGFLLVKSKERVTEFDKTMLPHTSTFITLKHHNSM